ncbi:MAG: orotidine-5'-phosphate decarboxylase [Candidatus Diapherotrites archaeon]|nr:orotidine-5'-phosphate decarboxylase [Candidatus Diapherotrites archaeon]
MNFADLLIQKIEERNNPSVVGLDPRIENIPSSIREEKANKYGDTAQAVAAAFLEFNRGIIDAVHDIVPAVKPQMAFYEQYGPYGVEAFIETVKYAKSKGLVVIEDAKRNDIGSTAVAYANGHLGEVATCKGNKIAIYGVDAITVNAYLGTDGIKPFVDNIKEHGRGCFILVKTSNKSSGELQDLKLQDGNTVYEKMAQLVNQWGEGTEGTLGYSSVGAVVGATYPQEAKRLREIMPKAIFLVPGYGAQGGGADDVLPCFNPDKRGAIVNSSRGIIFAYQRREGFTEEQYKEAARAAAEDMRDDLRRALNL